MFLLEFIFEILFSGLLQLVGAFTLWVLTGFSQPFKSILDLNSYVTRAIGFVVIVAIGVYYSIVSN